MRELFPTENLFSQHQISSKKSSEKNTSLSLEAKKIWEYVCDELRSHLGEEICKRWIFPIRAQASNEDELILIVPSIGFYQVVLSDYLELIERCKNKLGFEHISIVIDLDRELPVSSLAKDRNNCLFNEDSQQAQAIKEKNLKSKKTKLVKKKTPTSSAKNLQWIPETNLSSNPNQKRLAEPAEKILSNFSKDLGEEKNRHMQASKADCDLDAFRVENTYRLDNDSTHAEENTKPELLEQGYESKEKETPLLFGHPPSALDRLGEKKVECDSASQKSDFNFNLVSDHPQYEFQPTSGRPSPTSKTGSSHAFGKADAAIQSTETHSKSETEIETERRERIDEIVGWGKIEDVESKDKEGIDRQRLSSDTLFSHTLSRKTKLNPNYTFETFVRGPSNQFALAACYNVAENPGKTYNPLFIYGATGLGKTHLLHAVGNHIIKTNPNATIAYISSERFMNELIYCLRHNKIIDFRQKYRHCDLFLMDDIQFISGNKAATQEEFFHTFNTLYEAKKQIIITSDLFPQDIPDIEERLRNRFQWGLIADIQPPDIEHRIAILYSKAEQLGIRLSIDVAEYIANLVKRNVRELEGALHRLAAFAALHGKTLDKTLAMETFSNMISEDSSKPQMLIEAVQKVVAEHFQVKTSDLKSKRRHKALTLPRQVAMYLARKFTKTSYPEIGEKFGGKDHTTVMHAVRKITLERKRNMDLMVHLDALERVLERLN